MRVPHQPPRRTLSIGALALTGVLLAPALAFAEGSVPTDQHRDEAAGEAPCSDLLVTQRPTGTDGDASAVAITAQTLDAGLPGWSNVAWEAAPDVVLDAVQAADVDGHWRSLPATGSGDAAGGVTALRFCGTVAPPARADDVEVVGAQSAGGASTAATTGNAANADATSTSAHVSATHVSAASATADTPSTTAHAIAVTTGGSDRATGSGAPRSSAMAFGLGALAGLLVLLARRRAEAPGRTPDAGTPHDLTRTPATTRVHESVQASIAQHARPATRRRLTATTRESYA